jgi:hypothetical protein
MRKKIPRYGYMCLTDFNLELGEALGKAEVYVSVDDLKVHRPCVKECGIVKVKITFVEIMQNSNFFGDDNETEN